jgi:hypothetical protein
MFKVMLYMTSVRRLPTCPPALRLEHFYHAKLAYIVDIYYVCYVWSRSLVFVVF